MQIDGKSIAADILSRLTQDVKDLKDRGIVPTLSVILVGDDPASLAYIRQKQKAAETIGMRLLFRHEPASIPPERLQDLITLDNKDPSVHGLIVQRPVPLKEAEAVLTSVSRSKDVDGFLPDSPFDVPVAHAVGEILKWVRADMTHTSAEKISDDMLFSWLKTQKITVIGRGETAGTPLLRYFRKHDCATSSIHSKTPNPSVILNDSDIIVSCVGKHRVVAGDMVKPGAIVISVGLFRNEAGKLEGDYDMNEMETTAAYYTPTPGGVGPVNVACLMKNCVKACMMREGGSV